MNTPLLLVGRGRLARHLAHYLELESLSFDVWHRSSPLPFTTARDRADRIVLLISDDAIETFLDRFHDGGSRTWIHCSGSVSTPLAEVAHPLMTFSHELYDRAIYRGISFVTERGRRPFDELFPGLPNPHVAIAPEDRAIYHALCVLAGNGTTLLWMKALRELEHIGVPRSAVLPYLERTALNLAESTDPLTGPMARRDERTIHRNLEALETDLYHGVYCSLVDAHREDP